MSLEFAAGLALGALLGGLAVLLWRARSDLRARHNAAFGELARTALSDNSELFLKLADERLARQHRDGAQLLSERETAITALVEPIRQALLKTETQLQGIERDRIAAFAGVAQQIEALAGGAQQLSRETQNLVGALRRPEARGQWGELTLKRVVDLSGMTQHIDYTEQVHHDTEAGVVRPDMIVHMAGERDIVIDVKTPLDAYLDAVAAGDPAQRKLHLARHAQNVHERIKELSAKKYWAQFTNSPDYVVLFLPGEQFLSAALEERAQLLDEALAQRVVLATPTSLVALLKAVAHGWRQTALAQNATQIRELGETVYKRLAIFGEHLARLGKSLGASVDSYNKAVGSLEQTVLPAARRFSQLGMRSERDIDVLEPIDSVPREPRAAGEASSDTA